MSQGMVYREPPAAPGLPLPRARLVLFTSAIVAVSLLAPVMSFALLGARGGARAGLEMFKEGGAGMYAIALLAVVLPAGLGLAGAFVVRGRRVPAGLPFVAAASPVFVSVLFAFLAVKSIERAIAGASVDPTQASRIVAMGIAETLSLDVFGGLVTCGCAIVACVSAAASAASVDVAAASRGGPRPPTPAFAVATGIVGAAWLVATIALATLRVRIAGILVVFPVLVVLSLVPFAILAARASPTLRGWHDRAEASRGAAMLLVAGLAGVLAVLALERAAHTSSWSLVFSAISATSVDPSQEARILAELAGMRAYAPAAYAVHVVFGGTTFALALVPAIGRGPGGARHPFSPTTVFALVTSFALVASAAALAWARDGAITRVATRVGDVPDGVTLPAVPAYFEGSRAAYDGPLVLRADGTGDGSLPGKAGTCLPRPERVTVYADRATTFERLVAYASSARCPTELVLAATRERDPELEAMLGELAPLASPARANVVVTFDEAALETGTGPRLEVRSVADDAIEIDGARMKLPLPSPDAAGHDAPLPVSVRYVFRPGDTIEHVVSVIAAVERYRSPLPSYDRARTLVALEGVDAPPSPAPATSKPETQADAGPTVTGRLPAEVIARVVRSNLGGFRMCYEVGLRANPKLAGRVRVRFVIDRSGKVTSVADAGSDLPDASVVACVQRGFSTLTFPEPEGGAVTVVYPLTFLPKD